MGRPALRETVTPTPVNPKSDNGSVRQLLIARLKQVDRPRLVISSQRFGGSFLSKSSGARKYRRTRDHGASTGHVGALCARPTSTLCSRDYRHFFWNCAPVPASMVVIAAGTSMGIPIAAYKKQANPKLKSPGNTKTTGWRPRAGENTLTWRHRRYQRKCKWIYGGCGSLHCGAQAALV